MTKNPITREEILRGLDGFQDPELGRSIVRLDQVQDVQISDGLVKIVLGLTSFSAPLWPELREEVRNLLRTQLTPDVDWEVVIREFPRPAEKLGTIGLTAKYVIAVGSGKGGVGKSTIAAALALGLDRAGCKVGLLDADVYGPSIPHLLGSDERPTMYEGKIIPITVGNLRVMSMGFIVPKDEAVIWRGPMLHGAVQQFLRDTDWGDLDYLVVDMPPGTGDVAISLSQLLPVSGAVVVCTPQELALLDAVKAITMFRKVHIDVLGIVENMSYFICPNCGTRHDIFSSGGARKKADELGLPFLGEVPLNVMLRIKGDEGRLVECLAEENIGPYFDAICKNVVRQIVNQRRGTPPLPSLSVL
ncbi:MAG TPA: Mrp/NBP35 family ATP-binding protein [Thermogutta sp.]|nr:Mrp/NBP35 family ATP-binding protein [Thermogutta sp.]